MWKNLSVNTDEVRQKTIQVVSYSNHTIKTDIAKAKNFSFPLGKNPSEQHKYNTIPLLGQYDFRFLSGKEIVFSTFQACDCRIAG